MDFTPDDMLRVVRPAPRKPRDSNSPIRHHHLPAAALLRHFSKDDKIMKRNRGQKIQGPSSIHKVAYHKDFYTIVPEDTMEDDVRVEKFFALFEYDVSKILRFIRKRGLTEDTYLKTAEYKQWLALWIVLLDCRTPYFRRTLEAMTDEYHKVTIQLTQENNKHRKARRRTLRARSKDHRFVAHQNLYVKTMLKSLMPFAEAIFSRFFGWTLYISDEPGLLLGDNPILKPENHLKDITSPKDIAIFKSGRMGYYNADYLILPLGRDRWMKLTPEHHSRKELCGKSEVDKVNRLVVEQAWDSIYCHPDDASKLESAEFDLPHPPLMGLSGPTNFKVGVDGIGGPTDRHRPIPHRTADEWDWNEDSID